MQEFILSVQPIAGSQTTQPLLYNLTMSHRLLPLVLLLALSGCWEKPATTTWVNATGPESFERLMWKSIQAKDWVEVESRLASTLVTIDEGRVRDKTQTLEQLKQLEITDYVLGDFDVKPDGADAIVTYTVMVHGKLGGQPLPSTARRCMTVWQQQGKGWAVIAHVDAGPAHGVSESAAPSGETK